MGRLSGTWWKRREGWAMWDRRHRFHSGVGSKIGPMRWEASGFNAALKLPPGRYAPRDRKNISQQRPSPRLFSALNSDMAISDSYGWKSAATRSIRPNAGKGTSCATTNVPSLRLSKALDRQGGFLVQTIMAGGSCLLPQAGSGFAAAPRPFSSSHQTHADTENGTDSSSSATWFASRNL